jgi:DHA2 family multidrug resistance protein
MVKGVSPQIFVGVGFFCYIFFCFWMASFNADASGWDFFNPLILRGIGAAMLTVPLTNQAVMGLKPSDIPQGIAINNMMRQLGGAFGIAITNTYIANRGAVHRSDLIANVDNGTVATDRITQLTNFFASKGMALADAKDQALHMINNIVNQQGTLLSYQDAFRLVGIFFIICLPLIGLVKKKTLSKEEAAQAAKATAEAAH